MAEDVKLFTLLTTSFRFGNTERHDLVNIQEDYNCSQTFLICISTVLIREKGLFRSFNFNVLFRYLGLGILISSCNLWIFKGLTLYKSFKFNSASSMTHSTFFYTNTQIEKLFENVCAYIWCLLRCLRVIFNFMNVYLYSNRSWGCRNCVNPDSWKLRSMACYSR